MHLQGQKQRRRTTGAATMQEKETLVVQAKKMHSNSHNKIKEKTGAKPGKKPTPRAYPRRFKDAPWAAKPPWINPRKNRGPTQAAQPSHGRRETLLGIFEGHGVCSGHSVPSRLRHTLRRLKGWIADLGPDKVAPYCGANVSSVHSCTPTTRRGREDRPAHATGASKVQGSRSTRTPGRKVKLQLSNLGTHVD